MNENQPFIQRGLVYLIHLSCHCSLWTVPGFYFNTNNFIGSLNMSKNSEELYLISDRFQVNIS